MMMTSRSDIKDRLIHNQSPFPTKDKVLSYTIPVDHTETLLFCSSSSSDSSGPSSNGVAKNGANPDNDSLNFIGPDDDPCTGRDSLASFLDEGLGTSLDGVDEVTSPIFSSLARNESVEEIVCWKGNSSPRNDDDDISEKASVVAATTPAEAFQLVPTVLNGGSDSHIISPSSPKFVNGESYKSFTLTIPESSSTATVKLYSSEETAVAVQEASVEINHNQQQQQSTTGSGSAKKGNSHHQPRNKNMPLGRQGPQKCTICEKTFSNASALTKHKLTHSDERRHACATCGKAFKRQDHLNGHMLTHRNKKPFECQSKGCGKSYCDARSLRRHVENRHGHEVLESMNLTSSHKQGSKKGNSNGSASHHGSKSKSNGKSQQEPQQEAFVPIKLEYQDAEMGENGSDLGEPALEAKPQVIMEGKAEKHKIPNGEIIIPISNAQTPSGGDTEPPLLERMGDSTANTTSTAFTFPRDGVPIVIKKENISVFDFDETLEDTTTLPYTTAGNASTLPVTAATAEKVSPTIKLMNGLLDSSNGKLGHLADLKLIQEWAKKLGDSKVALLLSSSPSSTGTQLRQTFALDATTLGTSSGGSHAFIPTSENGIFSVTPISLVPTSSNEFSVKGTEIFMANDSTDSVPKPFYILPSQHLFPSMPFPNGAHVPSTANEPSKAQITKSIPNESKEKPEAGKAKGKSNGIGAALANRIKTKLKAGNLKKLGKGNNMEKEHSSSAKLSSSPIGKRSSPSNTSIVNEPPVLEIKNDQSQVSSSAHDEFMIISSELTTHHDLSTTGGVTGVSNGDHSAVGGITWCESPKEATEEDRLSDGGLDGDDKPVECTICCRRFKNTPALNGHMRLHGGYFKKETEGSKKKEVSKDQNHGTPLQTVSVSVRALIEEKIKERRNNLLKLAAAAEAEKAAKEAGTTMSSAETQSNKSPNLSPNTDKPPQQKSDKNCATTNVKCSENNKVMSNIAQQHQQEIMSQTINNKPLKFTNVKLNPELTSEKDKNCDQLINNDNCRNNRLSKSSRPTTIISNNVNANNLIDNTAIANLNLEANFQDTNNTNILIGTGNSNFNSNLIGVTTCTSNGMNSINELALPQPILIRDSASSANPDLTNLPFQVLDKSNFALLADCGISPDVSCQAYHIIYVDNNGESVPIAVDQGTLGKMAELFPHSASKMSAVGDIGSLDDVVNSVKTVKDNIVSCPPPQATISDDPSSLLWEWRNSTSSDNTDNSFGIGQDCTRSFLYSSSSDTGMESTKDPVAAGRGYCYTPILSPNSSFCLTPGPDSPFEVCTQNQSLSFMCPSPTIGDGPAFNYSNVPSIVNPPSSVENIFSPEQSQSTPPQMEVQQNLLQTFQNSQPLPLPKVLNSSYFPEFDKAEEPIKMELSVTHNAPIQSAFITVEQSQIKSEDVMDCLPSITTFPNIANGATFSHGKYDHPDNFKEVTFQCPINSNNLIHQEQQTFIPFEVFTPSPIPSRIADKWVNGKFHKTRKIHIGPEYQADIPKLIESPKKSKRGRSADEKLWDPHVLNSSSSAELENYLEFACCSAVPGGGMNKEYALHLLMLSKGNIREAILRLMEKLPTLPPKLKNYSYSENQRWTSEEIITFQISLFQIGKDFPRISKSIGTKCKEECASFYYFWKKVCVTQYHVMKQLWKGRLEHQQLQLTQENCNTLIDLISNNNSSFHNICSGIQ